MAGESCGKKAKSAIRHRDSSWRKFKNNAGDFPGTEIGLSAQSKRKLPTLFSEESS
jgi:hypothetical protein